MPYVEILSSHTASRDAKRAFVSVVTKEIMRAFNVPDTAVTVFFCPYAADAYAYRGELGHARPARVLIKLHAYRRVAAPRRAVALPLSEAAARCFATGIDQVAVYFLERGFDEVAHDGHLVADGPLPKL